MNNPSAADPTVVLLAVWVVRVAERSPGAQEIPSTNCRKREKIKRINLCYHYTDLNKT